MPEGSVHSIEEWASVTAQGAAFSSAWATPPAPM